MPVNAYQAGWQDCATTRRATGVRRVMNILSIQSWVAYGHVGNAAAMFPLQRLGAEVWAVNTVQFSNHPGYGDFAGEVFAGAHIGRLIDGLAARGALARCDAVLSGYIGGVDIGEAVLDAVRRVKAANPASVYCCDPVIGDEGGVYVREGISALLRDRALNLADIVTPNRFEVEQLTGHACATLDDAKAAITDLQAMGPRVVLISGLRLSDTPSDAIDLLAGEAGTFHRLRTPLLHRAFNGAGDTLAALFLFHRLCTGDTSIALAEAGSAVHGLLRCTEAAGSREILTVEAQDEFVRPSRRFEAVVC